MKNLQEVRNDYIDPTENLQYIDGYFTDDDMEQGKTIAVVCLDTYKVIFFDNAYRSDKLVVEAIEEITGSVDVTERKVEYAKNALKQAGYLVGGLWDRERITEFFAEDLTEEEVDNLAFDLFNNDGVIGELQISLEVIGDEYGLTRVSDVEQILLADVDQYYRFSQQKAIENLLALPFTVAEDDKEVLAELSKVGGLFDEVKGKSPDDYEHYWDAVDEMEQKMPTIYIKKIPYQYITTNNGDVYLWPTCRLYELENDF